MPAVEDSFRERSRAVARAFLQTVVVVDDQAIFYGPTAASVVAEPDLDRDGPVETVLVPGPGNIIDVDEDIEPEVLQIPGSAGAVISGGDQVHPKDSAHDLDAKALIDAFAEHDIVCAILRLVQSQEGLEARTLRLAYRADIVVLDWVLDNDNGTRTIGIIERILNADTGRLRLIAIYTAEPDLAGIAVRLAGLAVPGNAGPLELDEEGFAVTAGATRLVVFGKERQGGGLTLGGGVPGFQERTLSETELPNRLVQEFAELTGGLVPNLALRALATLRTATYPILQNLHKGLDAPFVTHRTLLPHPEDAANHLLALVDGELHAVLEQHAVHEEAGVVAVAAWLASIKPVGASPFQLPTLTEDESRTFLLDGTLPPNTDKRVVMKVDKLAKKITAALCNGPSGANSDGDASALDSEYAMRMALRTRYVDERYPPELRLGSIVALDILNEDDLYLLCMQPLCDSVRLITPIAFPFLPFHKVNPTEKTSLIVRTDASDYIHLYLKTTPSLCRMIVFAPDPNKKIVRAVKDDGVFVFRSENGDRLRWVADLKPDQAQRWADEYATALGRVGVDESEWLRRLGRG